MASEKHGISTPLQDCVLGLKGGKSHGIGYAYLQNAAHLSCVSLEEALMCCNAVRALMYGGNQILKYIQNIATVEVCRETFAISRGKTTAMTHVYFKKARQVVSYGQRHIQRVDQHLDKSLAVR